MDEIIFSYNRERCHAEVVDELPEEKLNYIGEIDGYNIYQVNPLFFDQFAFVAIKED